MRFIANHWYIAPIAATIAIYVCCISAQVGAEKKGAQIATRSVNTIYGLAKEGKYDEIRRLGLLSNEDTNYLLNQERCFGRITTWDAMGLTNNQLAWYGQVIVRRPLLESIDSIRGNGSHEINVSIDPSLSQRGDLPYAGSPTPLKTPKDVIAYATPALHSVAGIKSAKAERIGDVWRITEIVVDPDTKHLEKRYLITTLGGSPIEHVREKLRPSDLQTRSGY